MKNSIDLNFEPVTNSAPSILTTDCIDHYNRYGYIGPIDIFDIDKSVENRDYFNNLLKQVPDTGAYSINCYQGRCQGIWDICTAPAILDVVEDLIGPNIICWASHFFCKMPHDPKSVPWHQDASYWKLTPARTVTVWLAIDDADEDNSAMRFLPGTHDRGILKFKHAGENSVLKYATEHVETMGEPFSNNLKAGQVSLHADMIVHGSEPNNSDRRRCGLTIRYCPAEVEFQDQKWASMVEPIICRGSDPFGRWNHHDRPDGNDVSLQNSPHNVGGN